MYKPEILHQINVAKGLKLKFKKLCGLIYRFVEATRENLRGEWRGAFYRHSIMDKINIKKSSNH